MSYEQEANEILIKIEQCGNDYTRDRIAIAHVKATLALVEAQREATIWGKQQVEQMREQQEKFLSDLRKSLEDR